MLIVCQLIFATRRTPACGLLLGGAAAFAVAARAEHGFGQARIRPRSSGRAPRPRCRQGDSPAAAAGGLQQFLQLGLGILARGVGSMCATSGSNRPRTTRCAPPRSRRREKPRRTAPRAHRPGSRAAKPAALEFAFAQTQALAQLQSRCDLGQRVLAHQIGAQARQVAFGQIGKRVVERAGDRRSSAPRRREIRAARCSASRNCGESAPDRSSAARRRCNRAPARGAGSAGVIQAAAGAVVGSTLALEVDQQR